MKEFTADEADIGVRADIFVAKNYPEFSRSALEQLFDKDSVAIAGKPIKPSRKLRDSEIVSVDETLLNHQPEPVDLPIIYEDDDVAVVNKPAGILSHSKGALNPESTVASFIQNGLNDNDLTGNRAGIVHRLDRATSGVLITAKNTAAVHWLQKQFSLRKLKKTYLAIVEGVPEPAEAIIDAPIARNPKSPQSFYVNRSGKPSQTKYKLLKSFQKDGAQFSLLELSPLTGRTHQIRVHLAYINHPVAGDHVYGHDGDHLMLHSSSLEITLPNHKRRVFSAPAPDYIQEFTDAK
jgi:23S rRNA pseudouridine1911/1915/1917 synthase